MNGKILFHIDAPSGAGKTTFMHQLAVEFPNVVFRDLDDFMSDARSLLQKQYHKSLTGDGYEMTCSERTEFNNLSQELLDNWIEQNLSVEGVCAFVGTQWNNSKALAISTERRYLLDVHPMINIWRRIKRDHHDLRFWERWNFYYWYREFMRILQVRRRAKRLGYIRQSGDEIRKELTQFLLL